MRITPPLLKYAYVLKKSSLLRAIYYSVRSVRNRDLLCRRAKVYNKGFGSYTKMIQGSNNKITIGKNTRMIQPLFRIVGHNNTITIGENCVLGPNCSFWMEGNNINIFIGDNTTFTLLCHLNAQEDNSSIIIGQDCMFSNHIIVRTSDSHPIYDLESRLRINPAKPVKIGNHVWIAPDSKIMKGANIGDGCIVGSNTFVANEISENSLVVGMPARVVKTNVSWSREDIILHKK